MTVYKNLIKLTNKSLFLMALLTLNLNLINIDATALAKYTASDKNNGEISILNEYLKDEKNLEPVIKNSDKPFYNIYKNKKINLIFTNENSENFVNNNFLKEEISNILQEKAAETGFYNYSITHTQQEPNFAILSVTNYYEQDLIAPEITRADGHYHAEELERVYFNIYFKKTNNLWSGVLQSNSLKSNFFDNLKNTELVQTAKLIAVDAKTSKKLNISLSYNNYKNYKLPWTTGEAWALEMVDTKGRAWGWHNDHVGPSMDFIPPANSKLRMHSAADGVVEWICTQKNPLQQAGVRIRTVVGNVDYKESLRYFHINKNTLAVKYQKVKQGQYIGSISKGTNSPQAGCNMYSYNTHLHLGFPRKDFVIEGFKFRSDLSKFIKNNKCVLKAGENNGAYNCGLLSKKVLPANYKIDSILFKDKIYQFHKGLNSLIYQRESLDGVTWTTWTYRGGKTNLPIETVVFGDNLYQYVIGTNSELYQRSSPDGFAWSNWSSDWQGTFNSPVTSILFKDKIYQFHKGLNSLIYQRESLDGVTWTTWTYRGGKTNLPIETVVFGDNLYQYVIGTNSELYQRSSPDGFAWSNWSSDWQGTFNSPVTSILFKDKIYQFHKGLNSLIYQRESLDGVTWTTWTYRGGKTNLPIETVVFGDNLYQYVIGTNSELYQRSSPDGFAWSNWSSDWQGTFNSPVTSILFKDKIYQFHKGLNSLIYQRESLDGVTWTTWTYRGGKTNLPIETVVFGDNLYQYVIGTNSELYQRSSPDGFAWSNFTTNAPFSGL